MDHQKELTLVLWGIAIVGMFFLARGITGNVILNTYSVSDYCMQDKECSSGKICCVINEVGMCSYSERCQNLRDFDKEKPLLEKSSSFDIGFGLLVLLCVLLGVYSATIKIKKSSGKNINRKKTKKKGK